MSDSRLLQIYHRLPPPARSAVASLRGYYLNYSRYGAETETKVAQALEREFWSRGELEELRNNRLAHILERAATKIPYYRRQWETAGNSNSDAWQTLVTWPVLSQQNSCCECVDEKQLNGCAACIAPY